MDMVFIVLMMQPMKEIGFKARNKEKERSFLRVEAFSRDNLKEILSMDTEKCTIILQETSLKENGQKI